MYSSRILFLFSVGTGHTRQMAPPRPAAVAVHDDGDVFWEPLRIEPLINFRFLVIQPGRNCRLQANLCYLLKLTQGRGSCNDTKEPPGSHLDGYSRRRN